MGQWFNSTFEQYYKMNIDTINFLNKLKNASVKNELTTTVPSNSLTRRLIQLLYREGFIQSYTTKKKVNLKNESKETVIVLRSRHEKSAFSNLKIISTPAKQRFLSINIINRISAKKTLFVFSTTEGLLTLESCKKIHIGGVLLFVC